MGADYTQAQWRAIVEASLATDPNVIDALRGRLGLAIAEFYHTDMDNRLMQPAEPKARSWEKVAKSAVRLAKEISELEPRTLPTGFGNIDLSDAERDDADFDDMLGRLQSLETKARLNEARYDAHAALHGGRKDPTRQTLFKDVLGIWADALGNDLTYSRPGGGQPGGPLLRFMAAALRPVLDDRLPTAEGFASIVDREIKRRKAFEKTQEVV
jgi:hypothetical protein